MIKEAEENYNNLVNSVKKLKEYLKDQKIKEKDIDFQKDIDFKKESNIIESEAKEVNDNEEK